MASQYYKIDWYDASEDTTTEITTALATSSEEGIDSTLGNCRVNLINKLANTTIGYGTFGSQSFAQGTDTITIYADNDGSFAASDIIFYGTVDGIKFINKPKVCSIEIACRNKMYKIMSRLISQAYEGMTSSEIVTDLAGQLGLSTGTITATTATYSTSWTNVKAVDAFAELTTPDATGGDYFMIYFDGSGQLNYEKRPSSVGTLSGNLIYFVWGPEIQVSGIEQIIILEADIERRKDKMTNMVYIDAGYDMNENPVVTEEWDTASIIEHDFQEDDYCTKDIIEQIKYEESLIHGNKPSEYPSSYNHVMTFVDPTVTPVFTENESVVMTGVIAQSLSEGTCVSASETVTHTDGAPDYTRDTDYTMDYENGTITRKATGSISDGQTVHVDYSSPAAIATSDSTFNNFIVARAKQLSKALVDKMLDELALIPWQGTITVKGRNDLQIGWLVNVVIPRMATTATDDFTASYPVTMRIKNMRHKYTTQGWTTTLVVEEYIRPSV